MMFRFVGALFAALFAFGAGAEDRTVLTAQLPGDIIPEGLAWDGARQRWLLGSVHKRRIVAIDAATGAAKPFAGGLDSMLGLHVAPDGKTLWAAGTALPQADALTEPGRTGLWVFDLATGKLLTRYGLPLRDPAANLGDFVFIDDAPVDDALVIASDSGTGALWRFHVNEKRWSPLLPKGSFRSPQGLAPGRDANAVYLADYATGLWRVSVDDGGKTALAAPEGAELRGIDGLYRDGDRLIAIQNGTKTHRILLIELAPDAERIVAVSKLAEGLDGWDEPTLGQVVGARFAFVANSQWNKFDADAKLPRAETLAPPRIETIVLPKP